MIDGPTTFIWERYGATTDPDDFEDTGWTPLTSYSEPMESAVQRYMAVLNEQYLGRNPLPKRVLAVEVGGNRSAAQEFEPMPAKIKLEKV